MVRRVNFILYIFNHNFLKKEEIKERVIKASYFVSAAAVCQRTGWIKRRMP